MYYVYVIEGTSKKNRKEYYISYTANLKNRIKKHKNESNKTTKKLKKIKLIYYEACLNEKDARKREQSLKTGFGRGYLKRRLANYYQSL